MSGENYVNTASTATTSAPVGPSDLTMTVAGYTGWPGVPFWGILEKGTASAELVRVTNVAGAVLTITRGQGGTSATAHGGGSSFEHVAPADIFNRTETHMAATNAHGVTGNVVGTSGAQTVQDKLFRGAVKSQHSDALPAGITASFESVADNATARDGFVHRNTAGAGSSFAFRAQQSGTDRFTVNNTGNVVIAPSSGLAIATSGAGITVNGGILTANSGAVTTGMTVTTSGLVVSAGGLNVTGNATFNNNTTTTGQVSGGSLTTAGSCHAGGNLDTDANLIVDGSSILTGTVSAGAAVNAVGAVTGASGTFTGAVSAQNGKVATFNSGADYGHNTEISTVNGTVTRSQRQPLVHRVHKGAVAVTISSTTNVSITTFTWTPRTNCHMSAHFALQFQAASDGSSGGTYEPTESTFQLRLNNSTNTVNLDNSNLYTVTCTASDGFNYRGWTVIPVNFSSTVALTGGTTYTIEVFGARTSTSALSQILQKIEGDIAEVAVIADIT